jgi:hypothetical protein
MKAKLILAAVLIGLSAQNANAFFGFRSETAPQAASSEAAQRGQDGNGGAGVKVNGVPTTFYSAGFYSDANPIERKDVPGLNALLSFIRNKANLTNLTKTNLMAALAPINGRSYHRVPEDYFDKATQKRLVAEFVKVTKAPKNDIDLFAVTVGLKTYLLPAFFKLTTITQQQAILMHEMQWARSSSLDYRFVVNSEMAAQAYFENPEDLNKMVRFAQYFGTEVDVLKAKIDSDLASQSMNGLVQFDESDEGAASIPLTKLFGRDFFECNDCGKDVVAINIFDLSQSYQGSRFLEGLDLQRLSVSHSRQGRYACSRDIALGEVDVVNCREISGLTPKAGLATVRTLTDGWGLGRVSMELPKCRVVLKPQPLLAIPHPEEWGQKQTEMVALPVRCKNSNNKVFDSPELGVFLETGKNANQMISKE